MESVSSSSSVSKELLELEPTLELELNWSNHGILFQSREVEGIPEGFRVRQMVA